MFTEEKELLYQNVASKIETLISNESIRVGERLPSVRRLSEEQGVSVSTAFQAYYHLENKGLIEARPKSGYFVRFSSRHLPPIPGKSEPQPEPNHVNVDDMVASVFRNARKENIVSLSTAVPGYELLPVAKLNKSMMEAIRSDKHHGVGYEMPPGNESLRRHIAKRSLDWGGSLSADDVVITTGCMEALYLCLKAVAKPGDSIVIESPTYYGILQSIESLGMKAVEVATDPATGVCIDKLEEILKTNKVAACLFVTNYNNPCGSCIPDDKKKQLVDLLALKEIPLIEDDLYGDLHFGKNRPKNCKAFDKKGLVLLCSSFSKTLAPGYRVGWSVPGRYKEKIERLKFMTTIATATLPQIAIAHFLEKGRYDAHLKKIRMAFAAQVSKCAQAVQNYFPADTLITRPEGGCVLWVEMNTKIDSFELHRKALEQNVAIVPGSLFSAQMKYNNFIRLACGSPWTEHHEQAVEKVGKLAKTIIGVN